MSSTAVWFLTLAALLHNTHSVSTLLRGVDPALASLYNPQNEHFKCLEGATVISSDRLNDEYCDCFDGSDEPGTSPLHHIHRA